MGRQIDWVLLVLPSMRYVQQAETVSILQDIGFTEALSWSDVLVEFWSLAG